MVYSQQQAETLFSGMLFPEEQSTCPVYCMFPSTGFFAKSTRFDVGFITCTTLGRILIAKDRPGGWSYGSLALRGAKKLSIKKNFVGQTILSGDFIIDGKKYVFKAQIAPKVNNHDLPNQERNLERLIGTVMPFANQ